MTTDAPESTETRYSISNNVSYLYQVYCSYMLVYKNDTKADGFFDPELLKKSLNILVRQYYKPVAGWFQVSGEDIDVVFDSNKFNDPPITTQTLDIDYETVSRHVYDSNIELLVPAAPSGVIKPENPNIPMFLVKATYLESNEAMVLGVTYHHSLMDGTAFWMFMANWSALCKQLHGQSNLTEFDLPYPPTFGFPDIGHLHDPSKTFEHTEYSLVDADQCFKEFQPGAEKIVETILEVSVEQQHALRQQARDIGVSFTELLCAVLWKGTNGLRLELNPEIGSESSLYSCAVNPRARVGVSSSLCASPVINTSCERTVSEIAALDLRDIARLVHEAIDKCSGDYLFSSFDFLHQQRKQELYDERNNQIGKKLMLVYVCRKPVKCTVSSSRTFPIYNTDYGFGAPEYVRPPFLPFDGCMRIWPTPLYDARSSKAPLQIYVSLPENVDLSQSPLLAQFKCCAN
ncbi:hypothetical protein IW139_004132 [Coemansia sp. RSA 353]|nr:hypothetical protein LPJ62_003913 [Coemansia sp. RSA 2167]KAJ2169047.1 hypothetical protein GGH15_000897 [Coemansia sp. RSA 562]KAJ2184564.1 hypothetical protein EV181_004316 [Coemansia sp. RSA 532]KAJ2203244.1 hypothetical protein IW145_004191 [Coemansia sp. RSA 521]KAJ2221634.1 hypothetical protein EV180_004587 [Coemansia sp. RSA 518]KAJ2269442.1 hypothetical protein J3F81_004312 [Coemansia sp. RSA 371]KAJ2273793.1 hypothetical protein GGH14_004284 [Coemansia sp. RSA 370]KAJ2294899.1 hy